MSTDPAGMLEVVRSSADLWAQGSAIAWHLPQWEVTAPTAVVVAGMGGSGIAGDVAALVSSEQGKVPTVVVKGYDLPAWAGPTTPLVAVSHSGNTEETLAVVAAAVDAGCPVAAVTSGGALSAVVGDAGGPIIEIPGGLQPRASFPLLVPPTLTLLEAAGVLPGGRATSQVADALAPQLESLDERAAADAASLRERIPVFLGGRGAPALVAARAKAQVNENAERPAFAGELPEADHNQIVGWGGGPDAPFTLVPVREAAEVEHGRIGTRFDLRRPLLGDVLDHLDVFRLPPGPLLQRIAVGILYVDLLSVHLALLDGVDPTPVARISSLKQRMAES